MSGTLPRAEHLLQLTTAVEAALEGFSKETVDLDLESYEELAMHVDIECSSGMDEELESSRPMPL